ncbi:MAG: hypothetical protein IPM80_23845 [Proteobacteria bacterium]|nr:hypothetical protein [Pseudomonadota bacterium]
MSGDDEAPWLKSWRAWTETASKGFQPGMGQPFSADSIAGLADSFRHFARAIQGMMNKGGGEDFANRFIAMLQRAACAGDSANHDDFINALLASAPRALLGVFPDAGAGRAWLQWSATTQAWAHELLALPSIGPLREWQEMLKTVQAAALHEDRIRAAVDEHYRLVTRAALSRLALALEDHDGPPIRSVRALYDLWIDQAEAAYAERVMSHEFARDFAAWVNAGSALRLAIRKLGGRLTALIDAPGRDEIDVLLARQRDMQRELSALRAEREAAHANQPPVIPVTNAAADTVMRAAAPQAVPAAKRGAPRAIGAAAPRPKRRASNGGKSPATKRADATPPRAKKAPRGEFDIGHILDANK